jgi:hypothetical protein
VVCQYISLDRPATIGRARIDVWASPTSSGTCTLDLSEGLNRPHALMQLSASPWFPNFKFQDIADR